MLPLESSSSHLLSCVDLVPPKSIILIFDPISSFDLCFVQEILLSSERLISDLSSCWPGPSFWSPPLGRQGELLFCSMITLMTAS